MKTESKIAQARSLLLAEMCNCGELIRKYDDMFEDMGGHLIHESSEIIDSYIDNFLENLPVQERRELVDRIFREVTA